MYDLVIIGAGPAGLAASAYAIRKNLNFLTVADALGGKALYRVSIPGTSEHRVLRADQLITGFRRELEYLSERCCIGMVREVTHQGHNYSLSVEVGTESKLIECRSLLIATGTRIRKLGVPGESDFAGRGLGYSALSYSHLLTDRDIFLYGDSQRSVDSALEVALHARTLVLVLEQMGRYHEIYRQRLHGSENIRLLENRSIRAFHGDSYCRSVTLSDEKGETQEVRADAFFLELRPIPNSAIVAELVETDEYGHIVIDTRNRTSAAGVFAAGDVTSLGFEQSLVAVGEGAKSLLSAYEQLTWST